MLDQLSESEIDDRNNLLYAFNLYVSQYGFRSGVFANTKILNRFLEESGSITGNKTFHDDWNAIMPLIEFLGECADELPENHLDNNTPKVTIANLDISFKSFHAVAFINHLDDPFFNISLSTYFDEYNSLIEVYWDSLYIFLRGLKRKYHETE